MVDAFAKDVLDMYEDLQVGTNICWVCERDLDVKPHAEWEAEDCREEAAALKAAGLPPTASFLNPRYQGHASARREIGLA